MRVVFLIFILSVQFAFAQDLSLYEKHYFQTKELTLPYRYLRPVSDSPSSYPLLIFLHGAFERGCDNEQHLIPTGKFFLRDSLRKNYPAYLLYPQCPADMAWGHLKVITDPRQGTVGQILFPAKKEPTATASSLKQLIDSLIVNDNIDSSRIYIIGYSHGGHGVLEMIARYPERFAAGVSIAGGGNPATAKNFAGRTALWLFQGEKDSIVSPSYSFQFYKRLKRRRADVRLTRYPRAGHDILERALLEPRLLEWIFSKKKNP